MTVVVNFTMPPMPPMPTKFRLTVVVGILVSIFFALNFLAPMSSSWPWGLKVVMTFLLSNVIFMMGRYALWKAGLIKPDDED